MQVDHACTLVLSVFIKMSPPYIGPCRPTWSVSALFRRYGFMMGQFRNVSWAGPTHTRFTESLVRLWRCESRSSPSWGSRDRGGGGRRGGAGAEASATARRGMARDDGELLCVAVGALPWQQQQQQQQPTVSVSPPNSKAYPLPFI